MWKRLLLSAWSILLAWMAVDLVLHRYVLAPLYMANSALWRPLDQMNVSLIYVVTFVLIATFVATYTLLVRPKSLRTGVVFGAFIGLALGVSAGFGTYIHSPIPLALAWGWFLGGFMKAVAAGAIVGALVHERPTMPEWLERAEQLRPISTKRSATQTVRELRDGG